MRRAIEFALVIFLTLGPGFAQSRLIKPTRLVLNKGTAELKGSLRNSQEREYIFAGSKGETVSFINPKPLLFDVRIFDPASGFDTEYDSSRNFEVELPERADYVIYVRRKVGGPRTATYRISLRLE